MNHRATAPTVMHEAALGFKLNWYHASAAERYLTGVGDVTGWVPIVWCDVEPSPGQWDFSTPDQFVAQAAALGIQVHIRIRVGACWLTKRQPQFEHGYVSESEMPANLGAYGSFMRMVVQRYSRLGIHEYAVENEPNTRYQWGGTLAQLLRLTSVAATSIRQADPQAVVADWGLSTGVYGNALAQRLLRAGHGRQAVAVYNKYYRSAVRPVRVASVRRLRTALYGGQGRRDLVYLAADARLLRRHVFDVRQLHFYESVAILPEVLTYLRATTPASRPIQAWELGRHSTSLHGDIPAQVVKEVCLTLAAGVEEVDWLPMVEPPGGDGQNYALLDRYGAVSAAGRVYLQLAKLVARASYIRAVRLPGVHGVALGNGPRTTLVVWSGAPEGRRLSAAASFKIGDLQGAGRRSASVAELSSRPVLLTVHEPPKKVLASLR